MRKQTVSYKIRHRFKNACAQIDVQLKRRCDLIPNLEETAKGYLEHELGPPLDEGIRAIDPAWVGKFSQPGVSEAPL